VSGPLLEVQVSAGYGKGTTLHDVSFAIQAGERLGLVGSSGAGKSTLLLTLLGLLPWRGGWARGEVRLNGTDLLALKERDARRVRGKSLALVPQSPLSALNSALSLETHFREAWRAHEGGETAQLRQRMTSLLDRVQLPGDPAFLKRRPTQISVGQAQRCALALALLHRPKLLIADEPTSALDPATQVEVLQLLREVSVEEGTALLFVSHDLLSVFRICERVALLYHGCLPECLPLEQLPSSAHPGFREMLATLPVPAEVLLQHRTSYSTPEAATVLSTQVMTLQA
jgi:peptide/nickel transport system ATP-binding protein